MKLGLFQRPIKRDKEQEQALTTQDFDDYEDDAVVFAGNIKSTGNLETYLEEIHKQKDESELEDISSVSVEVRESIESGVTEEIDETPEISVDSLKNEEIMTPTEVEVTDTNEEKSDDISEESEHSEDFETESEKVSNESPENDGSNLEEETDVYVDDIVDVPMESKEIDSVIDDTVIVDGTVDDTEDSTDKNEFGDNSTLEDFVIDAEDSNNTVEISDNTENDDSVLSEEHKDLVEEMSMKEKFISLDIDKKKEYIQGLFAEFDELSEYLVEYREKIDQKVNDMQGSIKSLYLQISTCSLDDARGIVEKIQRYSRHNEALSELAKYIDNIMQN